MRPALFSLPLRAWGCALWLGSLLPSMHPSAFLFKHWGWGIMQYPCAFLLNMTMTSKHVWAALPSGWGEALALVGSKLVTLSTASGRHCLHIYAPLPWNKCPSQAKRKSTAKSLCEDKAWPLRTSAIHSIWIAQSSISSLYICPNLLVNIKTQ